MKKMSGILFLALAGATVRADNWVLEKSNLTYHVSHTLHRVEASSTQSRGKGVCDEKGCRFLVAAPVASFLSGDNNRDLHMLETTRGAAFPLVKVSVALAQVPAGADFTADLEIEFSGEKKTYKAVAFHVVDRAQGLHFKGQIPLDIEDFKIPKPSLLGMAIRSQVPVDVDMTWKKI